MGNRKLSASAEIAGALQITAGVAAGAAQAFVKINSLR